MASIKEDKSLNGIGFLFEEKYKEVNRKGNVATFVYKGCPDMIVQDARMMTPEEVEAWSR